jgi:hypothetical protein
MRYQFLSQVLGRADLEPVSMQPAKTRGPQYASISSRPLYGSSWRQGTGMGLPTRNRRCGPSAELSNDLLHLTNNEVGAAELRLGE